jgi:hypothetical protein
MIHHRRRQMDYLDFQEKIHHHFLVLVLVLMFQSLYFPDLALVLENNYHHQIHHYLLHYFLAAF